MWFRMSGLGEGWKNIHLCAKKMRTGAGDTWGLPSSNGYYLGGASHFQEPCFSRSCIKRMTVS